MVRNEKTKNPFVIEGYVSPDYFCDREKETALLTRHLTNGCNVTLMAPRRLKSECHLQSKGGTRNSAICRYSFGRYERYSLTATIS